MRLARGGASNESASRSLRGGRPTVLVTASAGQGEAEQAGSAIDKMADQRSARVEVQAAREEAGTARALHPTSRRTTVAASEPHRPPTSMPRTVRWQRLAAASSGSSCSLRNHEKP